jgi:SAM-dependent methyltransferase
MVFRDETAAEVKFFEQAFKKYVPHPVRRLLEPGCGSGRLVVALAKRGYDVTGLDIAPEMLNYLRRRLKRSGLSARVIAGDMTHMAMRSKYDAAFCTFNTFRHLLSEQDAVSHLRSVAECLVSGGVYLLGFHIIPLDAETESTERWTASHGGTKVHVTLKVIDFVRRDRRERLRAIVSATTRSGRREQIRDEFDLRLYTASQVRSLFAKVSDCFDFVEAFDFDYDITQPRKLNNDLTDALFVLRKR